MHSPMQLMHPSHPTTTYYVHVNSLRYSFMVGKESQLTRKVHVMKVIALLLQHLTWRCIYVSECSQQAPPTGWGMVHILYMYLYLSITASLTGDVAGLAMWLAFNWRVLLAHSCGLGCVYTVHACTFFSPPDCSSQPLLTWLLLWNGQVQCTSTLYGR